MAPLIPSSRPLNPPIAPVDTGLHRERKRQTRREAGTQSQRSPSRRWLSRRSADHHVTQPCARPSPSPRTVRLLCGATLALALLAAPAHAADTPFTPRFAQTARGDIAAVGNTLMTCPTATRRLHDRPGRDRRHAEQQQLRHGYVDVDADGDDRSTPRRPRSRSRRRDRPVGRPLLGRRHERGHRAAPRPRAPQPGHGAAAGRRRRPTRRSRPRPPTSSPRPRRPTRYRAFRDVTALRGRRRQPAPTRSPTSRRARAHDRFAGWALFVAYRDNAQPVRRLNVYDGLGTVDAAHTFYDHDRALPHAGHRHRDDQGRAAHLRGRRRPRHRDRDVQRPAR